VSSHQDTKPDQPKTHAPKTMKAIRNAMPSVAGTAVCASAALHVPACASRATGTSFGAVGRRWMNSRNEKQRESSRKLVHDRERPVRRHGAIMMAMRAIAWIAALGLERSCFLR
jgi:hypothetical protein